MACGPVKLNYSTYENIQKLSKKCGQKLRTNIFTTFGHFYDRLDDCAEFLLCILRKSILAEKIALTLNEEDTYHFLENPGFLKIPLSIATEITFHCDTFIFDSGRNLIDFIKIGDLFGANRYSLRLSNLNSYLDFCEDYLEIFQTIDPRKHLKNISFCMLTYIF
uniref:Uncharacterized protein n=1 Tax=Acrobeloides nanus TaxID=290746 RepID=A0A914BZB0_9BILA